MTKEEFIQIVIKDEDPTLLESDFVADMCAMHCDESSEDEAIEFDDKTLSLCGESTFKRDNLSSTAKALVREIAKFGITCDTVASERLHAFAKALIESGREQYAIAGNKIEKLDKNGTYRTRAMVYALITIGNIYSRDAYDLESDEL